MKATHVRKAMVARSGNWIQGKAWLVGGLMAVFSAACHNYTSAPLCNDDNAVGSVPPDFVGVYEYSTQDMETFDAATEVVEITAGTAPTKVAGILSQSDETGFCKIGNVYISESYDDVVHGYEQWVVSANADGLENRRLFYDRQSLEAAGIDYKIFSVPSSTPDVVVKLINKAMTFTRSFIRSRHVGGEDEALGILVDPTGHTPSQVLSHGKLSLVVMKLDRRNK